ncbi:hypothetical protein DPM19_09875 [Actinomadura craniellae]|uniref:Uncharacterized protein n=1 Tax=Actinomadura craniellae TaxID=2231787 RepID=A0A365H9T9_9ACTN|nr:hypothetical protein [Actinomadura craniellae]RAY15043.1 hypothetical protein DPM19_09875 [Actinomadura craniellae]
MAHFLALVLVDRSVQDPIARAEQVMENFWAPDFFDEETGERRPNVRCDGFVVGGRYDGVIWGKEQHYDLTPDQYRRRYGLDVVRPEDNLRPVSELVPGVIPYAIVTPDGQWSDCAGKPDQAWSDEVGSLLAEHRHRMVVAIDCHC